MENLFFDFDGTLANSEPGIISSLKYAVQEQQLRELTESEYRTFIGPPIYESMDRHYPELTDQAVEAAVNVYHERYVASGWLDLAIFPGLETTLSQLQNQGYHLYVASAKPAGVLKEIMHHFKLDQYFEAVFGATDEFPDKTTILRNAMQVTGATKSNSLMIGDTLNDINGGQNNQVKTIGVTYGFGEVTGATMVVNTPGELITAVQTIFN